MTRQLKLAIDGRNLTGPLSGISRYLSQIICHLQTQNIKMTILHHKPISDIFLPLGEQENVQFQHVPSRYGFPSYIDSGEDIFWGPAHRLPMALPNNLPTVVSVHDLVWRHYAKTMNRRTYLGEWLFFKNAVRRADKIICVSHATAKDLTKLDSRLAEKVAIIYPAADEPRAYLRHASKPFALFVGTLEPRKNIDNLIKAYAALASDVRDNLSLVIVGRKGWGDIMAHKLVERFGITAQVSFVQDANDDDIHKLYAACSFLVMPSVYEGFGLPIIEVMKYGKPAIVSNISSMPEVAGDAGLLIDPLNITSLTSAMAQLYNDKRLYASLAQKAAIRAQNFSWHKTALEMREVFDIMSKNKIS